MAGMRNVRRKIMSPLGLLLLITVIVGLAVAWSAQGSANVKFMVFGSPDELKAYRSVVGAFHERQSKIKVNLVEAGDRKDLLTRLSTSFAGGNPPDVFVLNYRYFGQYAAKGALEPTRERLEQSTAFQPDDFYSQALKAFEYKGEQSCIPQNISSLVVYYNRDMFKKAGLSEPKAGWTWNDMVAAAKALTVDTDGSGKIDQYGVGISPEIIRVAPLLWSNKAELFDSQTNPTAMTVDTPAARQALEQYLSLRTYNLAAPSEKGEAAESHESRFIRGGIGMLLSSRRSTPTFRKITNFDWDVAPLPVFKIPATVLHSDGYCMAKASSNKNEAWKFMEFALGPEGQKIMTKTGRTVPSLKSVAQSTDFLDKSAKPANSKVFLDSIDYMRPLPVLPNWPQIEDGVNIVLEEGFYQEVPYPLDDIIKDMKQAAEVQLLKER